MSNVQYTFVQQDGSLAFRSTVNSFGLDHVTDKDLSSFYMRFSSHAYFDTGLLPVDGTGLLSIRTAGNHTQVAYQHAPGMYYVNWGAFEGDRFAVKYYVAQPYRIIIGDFLNGNIYGARTFYSPVPINHPNTPLYHVNLPNINCRGYRGNGVGWICLYHSEDVSSYPFNEKLAKLIDRCSGTEAYNDANMSETDGPNFYKHRGAPSYIYDPSHWQSYSEEHGIGWTLDPDTWTPVLVKDRDNQDRHYDDGQPLTFVDALLGNYKCYYYDETIPKPVNALTRNDLSLPANIVFDWFKTCYNSSTASLTVKDPYSQTLEVRNTNSLVVSPTFSDQEDEEPEYTWHCEDCDEPMTDNDTANSTHNSEYICNSCFENYNFCVNIQAYQHSDTTLYLGLSDKYICLEESAELGVDYKYCSCCDRGMYKDHLNFSEWQFTDDLTICLECHIDMNKEDSVPF